MMIRRFRFLAGVFFLLATNCILWGQGQVGTLNGTILDPAGAVVPGAAVVITNNATGEEHKATSTSAGAYTIPYVPAGTYMVRVTAPGFRTSEAQNVIVRVAETLTFNVTMQVGSINESVTVSDTAPLLESGTAEIGRYINQAEYKSWPLLLVTASGRFKNSFSTACREQPGVHLKARSTEGRNTPMRF